MIPISLAAVEARHLEQLVADRIPESETLDFKRLPPDKSDRGRNEFLKDVCAMANGRGGDLVYGIDEADGVAGVVLPINHESSDDLKRRLLQVLDAGIEPRLVGLHIRDIAIDGGYLLVVRVPQSFNGPHRYVMNGHSKFVVRNGTLSSELTYEQLRSAFDRTASLTAQAKRFIEKRIDRIQHGMGIRPMQSGPQLVFHLVPVGSGLVGESVDVASLYDSEFTKYIVSGWAGATRSLNLEGIVIHPPSNSAYFSDYVQVFRSGAVEAVSCQGGDFNGRHIIPATLASTFFRYALAMSLSHCQRHGIAGPAVFSGALLGVAGYELGVARQSLMFGRFLSDRMTMILPQQWIPSIETADADAYARPLLDVMWQAFGADRCAEYTEDGVWQPHR